MSKNTQERWREEQAKAEIGNTRFAPGVRTALLVMFAILLTVVPVLQFIMPAALYARISGQKPAAGELVTPVEAARRITARVAAVSAPPDAGAVYRDFVMQLHVVEVAETEAVPEDAALPSELLLGVMGMHDRVILPVAGIRAGDEISVVLQPWSAVAARVDGLNSSQLSGDQFLLMPRYWAAEINTEGQQAQPHGRGFPGVWRGRGGGLPPEARLPVHQGMQAAWREGSGLVESFVNANRHLARRIDLYESALDDMAWPALLLRPPVQAVMAALGVGNEKALAGRDGWLFFTPDIEALTAPGFLEASQLLRRSREGDSITVPPSPDPRPAILDLHQQLAARGIDLVLMPTPVKPAIHPEMLSRRLRGYEHPVRNSSYTAFTAEMQSAGVRLYDPAPLLKQRAATSPQYLATDTHWHPDAMQAVAAELAGKLAGMLDPDVSVDWQTEPEQHTQLGDIATMLDMPDWQLTVTPETVEIQRVKDAAGAEWRPDPRAEVLLLGDSFANIYSLEGMGWGSGAGLAEHLSLELRRPLNRLTRNDAGAHATRELLADALRRDPGFLDSAKVVVWQFAERELSFGDWKPIALPEPVVTPAPPPVADDPFETPAIDDPHAAFARLAEQAEADEKIAIAAKDDWLFLVSELRHLAHPPAAHPSPETPEKDAFGSLVDLNEKLQELGIELLLLPVPPRAVIYADKLMDGLPLDEYGIPLRQDHGLQQFYAALTEEGVKVLDLTDDFLAARRDEDEKGVVCCEQDTHWSPRGIELAAARVAALLSDMPSLPEAVPGMIRQPPETITYKGDLVDRVPGRPSTLSATRVSRVVLAEQPERPVPSDPESPVMLLADSHGLVFSIGGDMHTIGAGLGEQLAYELGFSLDVMARRGSGDTIRRDLARRFIANPALAESKRVLIYCFAARTLTEGDGWRPVPLSR